MGRPSPAPGAAAAAVEHRQLAAARGGDTGEVLLRAEDLPVGREVAAVLARVGVADHHLERVARTPVEQLADERARPAEVVDRLEQRHDADLEPRLRREALGRLDVRDRVRHRDDQRVERLAAVERLHPRRRLESGAQPLVRLTHGPGVHAQLQRREVEAEDVEPAPQRRQASVGDARAAVRAEAPVEELELGGELGRGSVVVGAEPLPDRGQPPPVGLVGVLLEVEPGHVADRRVGPGHAGGHPPRHGELAHLAPIERERERVGPLDRLLDRVGADRGVAVEVGADPGPETERAARQPRAPRCEQARRGLPEAPLHEPEALSDLVDDARAPRAHLVGLPQDRDLLGERILDLGAPRGRQLGVVERPQQPRDPLVRGEDRPPRRLGRVRREDELDRDPRRRGLKLLLGDPRVPEPRERLGERLALHAPLALRGAAAADPVVLLGDVRELEVEGERAQHRRLLPGRERVHGLGQLGRGGRVTLPAGAGEAADPLLELEQPLALLLDEHATEQVAEQADVPAEGGVGAHRAILPDHLRPPRSCCYTETDGDENLVENPSRGSR